MTTFDRVKAASNPQDALLAIAQGIDSILMALTRPEELVDEKRPWEIEGWRAENDDVGPQPEPDFQTVQEEINALRERADAEPDPDDRKALEAQWRLQQDNLKAHPDYVPPNPKAKKVTTDDDGNVLIDLPPVSEEKQVRRAEFAREHLKLQERFKDEKWIDVYAKGGPLWLYHSQRALVMGLPDEWKVAMVQDVAEESSKDARYMRRDILKDPDPGNVQAFMEKLNG